MEYFKYRNYNIELNRKAKNKNIYFRIKSDGVIVVSCPYHIVTNDIIVYLDSFIDKIENKYDVEKFNKLDYTNGGNFMFLGKHYKIEYHQTNRNSCYLSDDKLIVCLKDDTYDKAKELIDKFLKEHAIKIFKPRFESIVKQFHHIDFTPILKIRKMTSKFGVCYYKKETVTLSTLLLHYDYECIDYVIVHELAHFIHPNHSKKFYYLIENYLPNYKQAEAKLKNLKNMY